MSKIALLVSKCEKLSFGFKTLHAALSNQNVTIPHKNYCGNPHALCFFGADKGGWGGGSGDLDFCIQNLISKTVGAEIYLY